MVDPPVSAARESEIVDAVATIARVAADASAELAPAAAEVLPLLRDLLAQLEWERAARRAAENLLEDFAADHEPGVRCGVERALAVLRSLCHAERAERARSPLRAPEHLLILETACRLVRGRCAL